MALTKQQIIEQIHEQIGIPKKECISIVDNTFEIIKEELENGEKVSISGFGKWMVREKRPRRGRNPQTGESITLSGRKVLTFKCSHVLRHECNS